MRIFPFTTLDDPAADARGSYTGFPDPDAGNVGDTPPGAGYSGSTDRQAAGIPPYQSTTAAIAPFNLPASDPMGAGDWLSQVMQTPQSGIDGWLTQAMQSTGPANQWSLGGPGVGSPSPSPIAATSLSASGPGFNADWPLITGISGLAVPPVVTPNPSQTHTS